jgi:hypothetical protein
MTAPTMAPLSALLAEVAAGTPTVAEMARNTGLGTDVLRAGLDHLVRTGRLQATNLPIGCPPSGCGGCAAAGGCGVAEGGNGLVTLSLTRR